MTRYGAPLCTQQRVTYKTDRGSNAQKETPFKYNVKVELYFNTCTIAYLCKTYITFYTIGALETVVKSSVKLVCRCERRTTILLMLLFTNKLLNGVKRVRLCMVI